MRRPVLLLLIGIIAVTAALAAGILFVVNRGAGVRVQPADLVGRWRFARAKVSFRVLPTTASDGGSEGQAALYVFEGVVRLDMVC